MGKIVNSKDCFGQNKIEINSCDISSLYSSSRKKNNRINVSLKKK